MILLDTHILVWTVLDPDRLSRPALREIERARHRDGIAISAMTTWELALLLSRGRIRSFGSVEFCVRTFCEDVHVKPITVEIAALATQFSSDYPSDPVSRLIGATARAEGLTLVTRDEGIRRSPLLKTVW